MPQQFTSFVGREKELAEIGRSFADPFYRLVTLAGSERCGQNEAGYLANKQTAHRLLAQTYHHFDELEQCLEQTFISCDLAKQMDD